MLKRLAIDDPGRISADGTFDSVRHKLLFEIHLKSLSFPFKLTQGFL